MIFLEIMYRNNNDGKAGITNSITQQPVRMSWKSLLGKFPIPCLAELYLEHLSLELLVCTDSLALALGAFGCLFSRAAAGVWFYG